MKGEQKCHIHQAEEATAVDPTAEVTEDMAAAQAPAIPGHISRVRTTMPTIKTEKSIISITRSL
jgi:hypothetical protein